MTECGFVAHCGRRPKHRGHHGGWRTGVSGVAPSPYPRCGERLGAELSPRELQVIAERYVHGDVQAAADCLGMSYQTAKNHVCSALRKTGAVSAFQVPLILGWVTFPAGLAHGVA